MFRLRRGDGGRSGLYDLEADSDVVRVRCVAEANPPADVIWRKAAGGEAFFR